MTNTLIVSKISAGLPIPYYHVAEIKIDGNVDNLTKLYGNYFIIDIPTFQYFHIINEKIGQYELLKDIIPGLKLVCISDSQKDLSNLGNKGVHNNMLQMLEVYGIDYQDIVFLESTSLWIENIFYFNTRINKYLLALNLPKGLELFYDDRNHNKIHVDGFRKVQFLYQEKLYENNNYPKKIFITRRDLNNEIRYIHYLLTNQNTLSEDESKSLALWCNNYGGEKYLWQLVRERFMLKEDEDRLEQYFISKGYYIVDPADMKFFEQINHYYNATHIASVRGSGLVNTIFCKNDAKVFILDVTNEYDFEYKEIVKVATEYVYEIPVKRKDIKKYSKEVFSVENIIAIIDNHYLDKI